MKATAQTMIGSRRCKSGRAFNDQKTDSVMQVITSSSPAKTPVILIIMPNRSRIKEP
ncbi:MAG: hypothetical protein ING75_06740 [Rhodocyclaceae bacterium]|nr:hypothetical protein [Rhodocyclaceae bacterium]